MSTQAGVEVLVVAVTEEVDHHTALDFRAELQEGLRRCEAAPDPPPVLVVDLSQVKFLDSTGIRELIDTDLALGLRGGRLVVRGADGVVRRCLEITGVMERLGAASSNGTHP